MDLRTRRTLRSLRTAFLEMRRELPLERVTVRALCERAEVSKATFYLHYHSVYDLSAELQAALVREVVDSLENPDALLEDPRAFTRELFDSFVSHAPEIDSLFSRGQEHALTEQVERALLERVLAARPQLAEDRRFCALLTYQVHGAHATYMRHARAGSPEEREAVIDAIADASDAVARLW